LTHVFCTNCGFERGSGSFCTNCGTPLAPPISPRGEQSPIERDNAVFTGGPVSVPAPPDPVDVHHEPVGIVLADPAGDKPPFDTGGDTAPPTVRRATELGGVLALLHRWGLRKVVAVAATLAVVAISLAAWAFAGRTGSGETASPRSPASSAASSKVSPTKASAAIAGSTAAPALPAVDPTSEPTTSAPVAATADSPLANVDWASLTYGLDCSALGMGVEIVGKDFFDVTGDGVKEALVRVACKVGTGPSPDPVYVFDGGSAPVAPRLLGTLTPMAASVPHETKTVKAKGSLVTLSGLQWGSGTPNCCGDINWTQTYTWAAGKFKAGEIKRDRTDCGDGVSAGPATSCPFALNVNSVWQQGDGWKADAGVIVDINVYSPVTQLSYLMHCQNGRPTACRGGNKAVVYIQ
jgi:hypothetical protein